MGVISLHNVILGGNDRVENEQDHPLVRVDLGARPKIKKKSDGTALRMSARACQ